MDLHRHFDTLAGPEVTPTMTDINADLDRGRRALRKRRTVQKITGSAFAAAALAAGLVIATNNVPAPTAPTAAQTQGQAPAIATRLVAYTGSQPKGYTIDKVPNGWEIQSDDEYKLLLAPKDAIDKDPNSFVGKIAITLQSKDQHGVPKGKKVKVGKLTGVLVPEDENFDATTRRLREEAKKEAIAKGGPSAAPFLAEEALDDANDGATLWVKQPNGVHLTIQFWEGLGLNEADKLTIGAGVHVHKGAEQGVG
jgi:hypothetical protein